MLGVLPNFGAPLGLIAGSKLFTTEYLKKKFNTPIFMISATIIIAGLFISEFIHD